jgi:hypothetical protein
MPVVRSPELGTIVHFEHVNFRVPDHRLAHVYFCEGLGFTRDPTRMVGIRNMWVNIGTQQIHLPAGPPTPFKGEVGVIVPDLDVVAKRLGEAKAQLEGTLFSCEREGETLRTTTPWGHRIRVHPFGMFPGRNPQAIPYVEFWVPKGAAAGIAAFYRDVIGCPAEVEPVEGAPTARVTVGRHQQFRFVEKPDGGVVPHNNHVAVYLTRFHAIYSELGLRGCIMEEDIGEQFRFNHIKDPASGQVLYSIEHEMRSLHHPDFGKPLFNRVPVPYLMD